MRLPITPLNTKWNYRIAKSVQGNNQRTDGGDERTRIGSHAVINTQVRPRKGVGMNDPSPKASIDLLQMNLPCSPDSPIERAGMSLCIEQHQPGQARSSSPEPREEEAGPSSKGIGSDPALSRQSDCVVQCFGSPRQTRPRARGRQPHAPPRADSWWLSKPRNVIRHCWKC